MIVKSLNLIEYDSNCATGTPSNDSKLDTCFTHEDGNFAEVVQSFSSKY